MNKLTSGKVINNGREIDLQLANENDDCVPLRSAFGFEWPAASRREHGCISGKINRLCKKKMWSENNEISLSDHWHGKIASRQGTSSEPTTSSMTVLHFVLVFVFVLVDDNEKEKNEDLESRRNENETENVFVLFTRNENILALSANDEHENGNEEINLFRSHI